jgi:hypothetical protein
MPAFIEAINDQLKNISLIQEFPMLIPVEIITSLFLCDVHFAKRSWTR